MEAQVEVITFGKVLEDAMKLSSKEREMLVDILKRRENEAWRDELAEYVKEVDAEIKAGKYKARDAEEVIRDLEKSLDEPDEE